MNSIKYNFMLLVSLLILAGCQSEGETTVPVTNVTTTIQLTAKQWSYLNLERGVIVGTSTLGDTDADAQWKQRTDWDIAFCDDMIRTNSGSSGRGEGGIQMINEPFDRVHEAPIDGYIIDTDKVEIW